MKLRTIAMLFATLLVTGSCTHPQGQPLSHNQSRGQSFTEGQPQEQPQGQASTRDQTQNQPQGQSFTEGQTQEQPQGQTSTQDQTQSQSPNQGQTSTQPQAQARAQSFDQWLAELRTEAQGLGISAATLAALDELEAPIERVLELDNSQPEFVQTFTRYVELRVTPAQIARGQALLAEHRALLGQVQQRYGVQPHYLVAFWAIESNFGRNTGGFSVLQALATLAYDPRRAEFFRHELLTALKIIDAGHIAASQMSGSWAGGHGAVAVSALGV